MTTPALPVTTDYDIIICGAGPVGLSVAALLQQRGTPQNPAPRVALIDAKAADAANDDPRTLARHRCLAGHG